MKRINIYVKEEDIKKVQELLQKAGLNWEEEYDSFVHGDEYGYCEHCDTWTKAEKDDSGAFCDYCEEEVEI